MTKASAQGRYNAHLLTVIDKNGIPFDLTVSENKEAEGKLIYHLAKMPGSVICAEGQIAMPFMRGMNTSFKLWGVAGAEQENPQIWHADEDDANEIIKFAAIKRRERSYA